MSSLFAARDYRRPSDRVERQLNWCTGCKYGRLDGQFTPGEVASFYPLEYYTHGNGLHGEVKASFLDRLRAHLAWRFDQGTPLRPSEIVLESEDQKLTFCDLGCGAGMQLGRFRKAGYQVIGVEPDPAARALAQSVGEVLDGTAESIPSKVADMRFNVVLMSRVLEHCIDPMKALANVWHILEPIGTLVIEVPNNDALGFSKFGPIWPWTDIPRHLNFFTERSLRAALWASGFSVTQVNYVGYARQFQSEWIRTQELMHAQIGSPPQPNFRRAAWMLLFRTAWAPAGTKYDSLRVHAHRR